MLRLPNEKGMFNMKKAAVLVLLGLLIASSADAYPRKILIEDFDNYG